LIYLNRFKKTSKTKLFRTRFGYFYEQSFGISSSSNFK